MSSLILFLLYLRIYLFIFTCFYLCGCIGYLCSGFGSGAMDPVQDVADTFSKAHGVSLKTFEVEQRILSRQRMGWISKRNHRGNIKSSGGRGVPQHENREFLQPMADPHWNSKRNCSQESAHWSGGKCESRSGREEHLKVLFYSLSLFLLT